MKTWISKRAKSFVYATKGILYFIKTQPNAWIHLGFAGAVVGMGFFLKVSIGEWMILLFLIAWVLSMEALNTAIEVLVDLVSPEFHPKAGIVKDVAAGAVLFTAIASALIGLLIFVPKIWLWVVEVLK